MQLCFGCLHTFPPSSLTGMSFDDETSARFQSIRAAVAKLDNNTPAARQCIAGIEEDIKALARCLEGEMRRKDQRVDQLQAQIQFMVEQDELLRKQLATPAEKPKQRPSRAQTNQSPYASGLLARFMAASQKLSVSQPRSSTKVETFNNRYGDTVVGHGGGSGGGEHRLSSKPGDAVAATLYNAVEAIAVRTRSDIGILWLSSLENEELVAPIVVSQAYRRTGPPQRISTATSTPGAVFNAGIALNINVPPKTTNTRLQQQHETLASIATGQSRSMLLVPVFRRYGAVNREALGVLQLIAGQGSLAFDKEHERISTEVATLLSHIASTYDGLLGDVCNRQFDPTPLVRHATYFAAMDQNPQGRGTAVLDHFHHAPSLIHRVEIDNLQTPGQRAGARGGDSGPRSLAAADITSAAVVQEATNSLRELNRYVGTLEVSWKNAVNDQTDLQRENADLGRKLDSTKQTLSETKRTLEALQLRHAAAAAVSQAAAAASRKSIASGSVVSGESGTAGVFGSPRPDLTSGDLDEIEHEATARLKGHLSMQPLKPSTARDTSSARPPGRQVFLTEPTSAMSSPRASPRRRLPSATRQPSKK